MLQAIIRKGSVSAEEVPAPIVSKGGVLIRVVNSCISAGTEMASLSSGSGTVIRSLLKQPEKVSKILMLIRSEGLSKLLEQYAYLKKSGQPTGYSVSGIVIACGSEVEGFSPGDQVAASGGGYAFHAEFVDVPKNLVVKIPSGVGFAEASTLALGAIALHGVRRTETKLGEFVVVIGAGILGLLAMQLLKASGIRVIITDKDKSRLEVAHLLGADLAICIEEDDPVAGVMNYTAGKGADAVLFAAATSESHTLSQAFQMCRRKGTVVLMGVSGMEINRKDIYAKEIDFKISTSYGPGRYDLQFEEQGIDYPYGYVRWTERRNFEEYLRLIQIKNLNLNLLINKIFPIDQAGQAFESLKTSVDKPLIVLLDYGLPAHGQSQLPETKMALRTISPGNKGPVRVGLLGTGQFALSVHLPNLKHLKDKYTIHALASQSGIKAKNAAQFYGATYATTRYEDIIHDPDIELVMICTRHGNHARLALEALRAGKHVFVEKPLATTIEDLEALELYISEHRNSLPILMVGYNRRYSPSICEIKKYTDNRMGPLYIHYRMNAGFQPADHWVHQDGGRIVGEACHLVDLTNALINHPVLSHQSVALNPKAGKILAGDNLVLNLKYGDGSIASIQYVASGNRKLPKEYMEIHFDEKSIVMDDYKSITGYGLKTSSLRSSKSHKGHLEELEVLYDFLSGQEKAWPVPPESLFETTRITLHLGQ